MRRRVQRRYSGRQQTDKGFALVATVAVMSLLLMVALGMLSLAAVEMRHGEHDRHRDIARSNARVALMLALGQLQKLAGPDQRVTARAEILEPVDDSVMLPNKNWTGVWKTTWADGGREWPLIGKAATGGGGGSPYPYEGVYTDLREGVRQLAKGAWRQQLLEGWLVSGPSSVAIMDKRLKTAAADRVEMLGRGTLGHSMSPAEYEANQVQVDKIRVSGAGSPRRSGACAWYVSDNNQKASVALEPGIADDSMLSILSARTDNPASVKTSAGTTPFRDYQAHLETRAHKIVSHRSAALIALAPSLRQSLKEEFGAHFHHFTTAGTGLFTDTALGGLKKDLTPLMFGRPERTELTLTMQGGVESVADFSSENPIIPGAHHGVLGPSFAALRYWGRMKSLKGLAEGVISAQVIAEKDSLRVRPANHWPYGITDGTTFDGGKWASAAPKIHPVMTDCRWHFYFSHTDDNSGQSIRTHLIPRVCLWNPYAVKMEVPSLLVLMPNPYWQRLNAFHFHFSHAEGARMNNRYLQQTDSERQLVDLQRWGADGRYKIRLRGSAIHGRAGLFPDSRYLGFVLEGATFQPGECLVWSPRVEQAGLKTQGVAIKRYNKDNIAANVLSASSPQGEDHFFHDYACNWMQMQWQDAGGANHWMPASSSLGDHAVVQAVFRELRLSEVELYEPWAQFHDSFPFVLKAIGKPATTSSAEIVGSRSESFPTLQLINHGNGGASSYDWWQWASWWGSSASASNNQFGRLTSFIQAPRKNAPALHQIGCKLLWLDESSTEANAPPLRVKRWGIDHLAYNPAPIAYWNVRPGLASRSPASPVSAEWYVNSSGAWMLQLAPYAPRDAGDMPWLNGAGRYFTKSPLGAALQFASMPRAALFDLPDPNYGALSLGSLRHAQLSPYSWHPSYLVGHSLADWHAPYAASAHPHQAGGYGGREASRWDESIGGTRPYHLSHGPRTWGLNSTGLLQLGREAITKRVNGQTLSSRDEVMAYDIAYEVNHNLWDGFFLSGMPLSAGGSAFDWDAQKHSGSSNPRYRFSAGTQGDAVTLAQRLTGTSHGDPLAYGFWNNACHLVNRGGFNVNSTSVQAWTAFLSGLQGLRRPTEAGLRGHRAGSVFARTRQPLDAFHVQDVGVDSSGGWAGGRILTEDEIRLLADKIVREVRQYGPFVSMADFVNRRLAPKENPASRSGALQRAIERAGLNDRFAVPPFTVTTNNSNDNNRADWQVDLDKQPDSKAWGLPGYLTQGDLLEPLGASMTVRGDSFTVRAYGESRRADGTMAARAWLEALVERTPDYVNAASPDDDSTAAGLNKATEPAHYVDYATGALHEGDLSMVNRRFGRRFKIISFRWLNSKEV